MINKKAWTGNFEVSTHDRKCFWYRRDRDGVILQIYDSQSMTRNESRLGFLADYKDCCKAHIILHYIAVLIRDVGVYAIGMVGRDEQGERRIGEMRRGHRYALC